jgi:hypothetical protein
MAVLALAAASVLFLAPSGAHATGGNGALDVYQLEMSYNCNTKAFCGSDLGGFWAWAELDRNPVTGATSGELDGAGCAHGEFNGAVSVKAEITRWWVAPGSAGPTTLFTDEVDTSRFRGQVDVETLTANDTGVNLVPGHQTATSVFGFRPPPGVAIQIQIAYKPAH